jgi:hypothetical protein
LQSSIPFKVSKLADCNLEILSKLQVLQIAILKYSILASRLFGSLIDSWFRPPGSNLLPSSDQVLWILGPASQIIEFNEIPMIFQYSQKPSKWCLETSPNLQIEVPRGT